jgi:predicted Zn-dependent protease
MARRWAGTLVFGGLLAAGGCAPAISTQQEAQLGAQAAADINRQLPIVQDAQINNYINQLGSTIARVADPSGRTYRFYVVNAKEVNAFALPGGYVYVNRGLIDRADNMSELAGVLGHEIGHVVERHSVTQLQRAQNANLGLAVVYGVLLGRNPSTVEQVGIQGVGSAVFAGYSRDAEREADHDAVKFVVAAGINPEGIPTFFQKLLAEQQRAPSTVERWFSTHPLTQERLQTAQSLVAQYPATQLRSLTTDTQAYRDFRARVRSLPAPTQ